MQPKYSATTFGIKITVTPKQLDDQSDPEKNLYAFSYTITMENTSKQTVQLLDRHWIVLSNDQEIANITGEGVVGLQPTLEPGEVFTYTSGTVIQDPVGSMYGTYTFKSGSGSVFEAEIPRFDLFCEELVN